jgi:hypothetical protein
MVSDEILAWLLILAGLFFAGFFLAGAVTRTWRHLIAYRHAKGPRTRPQPPPAERGSPTMATAIGDTGQQARRPDVLPQPGRDSRQPAVATAALPGQEALVRSVVESAGFSIN